MGLFSDSKAKVEAAAQADEARAEGWRRMANNFPRVDENVQYCFEQADRLDNQAAERRAGR